MQRREDSKKNRVLIRYPFKLFLLQISPNLGVSHYSVTVYHENNSLFVTVNSNQ